MADLALISAAALSASAARTDTWIKSEVTNYARPKVGEQGPPPVSSKSRVRIEVRQREMNQQDDAWWTAE